MERQAGIRDRLGSAAGAELSAGAKGRPPDRRLGYAAALGAALFAGFIPVVAKRDLGAVDPLLVAGFTNLFAGLALLPIALRPTFRRNDAWRLGFVAAVGAFIAPILYFTGLRETTASEASVLVNVETVFTFTLAVTVLRERARASEAVAVAAVIAGAVVLTTNLDLVLRREHLAANLLIIASTAFWASDNTVSTGLARRHAPHVVAAWKNFCGSAVMVTVALALGSDLAPLLANLGAALLVGVVGISVSLTLFYVALRHIGAFRTSAMFGLQGLFGAAGGYLFVGERLSVIQIAGSAVMIAAVGGLAYAHRKAELKAGSKGAATGEPAPQGGDDRPQK